MIQTKCGDLNEVEVLKTMKNHEVILNVGTVRDGPQIITEGESNSYIFLHEVKLWDET